MIQSMTGFSRVSHHTAFGAVTVELRSINHRYLEINQRLPDGVSELESEIGQAIRAQVRRGRVDVTATVQGAATKTRRVILDETLIRESLRRLTAVKARYRLKGPITLEHVLMLPHVISVEETQSGAAVQAGPLRRAVQAALRGLVAMRVREGQRLIRDIRAQAKTLARRVRAINARLPRRFAQQQHRFRDRIKTLLGPNPPATTAQIQEAVAFLKDIDINEELVRLESHLQHLAQLLDGAGPIGKQLDFIAQELMREANTIGAKANDARVAREVVAMKEAVEKIREQAQNLE